MKKYIPWWLKIIAKIILSRIPINYNFWQRVGLFRHGYMDEASYVLNVFNGHVLKAGLERNIQGKTILELGPGDSVSTAIIAACYNCSTILIDVGFFARTDIDSYLKLVESLKNKGLSPPDISKSETIDDVLVACKARYLTHGLTSLSLIEGGTVDMIFSQAVLEHVRKHEFLEIMRECIRVLAPEGVASHSVDLKDHLGGSLNNLRFSESLWESDFFVSSGFYTNRIRLPQMKILFEDSGFTSEIIDIRRWEYLPIKKKYLSQNFLSLSDDDLIVSGFDVLLHKKNNLSSSLQAKFKGVDE